jgi:phage-related protein
LSLGLVCDLLDAFASDSNKLLAHSKIAIIAKRRLEMWRWLCYDDKDPRGPLWSRWYCEADDSIRGRHDVVFDFLEVRNGGQWREPHTKKLGKGIIEIRITGDVQHRLLGFFGPKKDEFTFVLACTHKQNVYTPKNAKATAAKRKRAIEAGEAFVCVCDRPE